MMTTKLNRRNTSSRLDASYVGGAPTITVALDTIPIRAYGSDIPRNISLADIEIVRPSSDGLVDVVYTVERDLPSDLTVREIKSGESTIDQVLIALGWQAGMPHNEDLAVLTRLEKPWRRGDPSGR